MARNILGPRHLFYQPYLFLPDKRCPPQFILNFQELYDFFKNLSSLFLKIQNTTIDAEKMATTEIDFDSNSYQINRLSTGGAFT